MAKGKLTALDDLKDKFQHFEELQASLADLNTKAQEINAYNKAYAGSDDVGKTYHASVDKPTKQLTDLVSKVTDVVGNIGKAGTDTTKLLDNADQDAAALAAGAFGGSK